MNYHDLIAKFRKLGLFPRRDRALDDYFAQLISDYRHADPQQGDAAAKVLVDQANEAAAADRLSWATAFAVERTVLRLLPDAEVSGRAWHIRERYRRAATKDQYEAYDKDPLRDAAAKGAVLRNELDSLLLALTDYYRLKQGIDAERTEFSHRVQVLTVVLLAALCLLHPAVDQLVAHALSAVLLWAAALLGLVVTLAGWWARRKGWQNWGVALIVLAVAGSVVAFLSPPSTSGTSPAASPKLLANASSLATVEAIVVIAGLFGGAFSMLTRVQSPTDDGDPLSNLFALRTARREVFLSPIVGAVGALVLYCIFAAGLLKGPLFPELKDFTGGQHGVTFLDFLRRSAPSSGPDLAKLLVWSFIAGFSERFVPDAVARLTTKARETATK